MKRFSSALCLADHLAGAQVAIGLNLKGGDVSPDDTQTNLDQQALFSAVEKNLVDRSRAILERGSVDVNRLSQDKLSCLDMAILQRNLEMVHLLQQYGAQESFPQMAREARANQLYALYCEAKRTVEDLTRSMGAFVSLTDKFSASNQTDNSTTSSNLDHLTLPTVDDSSSTSQQQSQPQLMLATGSILSSALLEEKQLQLQCWLRRLDLFMHMRYELERLQVPSVPELVILQVVGESSLGLKIIHSLQTTSGSVCSGGLANRIQAPPGRLNCRRAAGCSHWLLDELALWQPSTICKHQLPEQRCNLERLAEAAADSSDHKLAAFNQLLAQQLEQLKGKEVPTSTQVSAGQDLSSSQSHSTSGTQQGKNSGSTAAGSHSGAAATTKRLHAQLSSGAYEKSSRLERRDGVVGLADEISLAYQLMSCGPDECSQRTMTSAASSQPSIITKYLIEWALEDEAANVEEQLYDDTSKSIKATSGDSFRATGSLIIHNSIGGPQRQQQQPLKCRIENLESGRRYRVRVAAGNHAGFSKPQESSPSTLAPSSWRQLDGLRRRRQDDEEIFRKFTKLFLLNKHLLDERHAGPIAATTKSSLINMLMVDATSIPSSASASGGGGTRINQHSHQLHLQTAACSSTNEPTSSLHLTTSATSGTVRKNLKNFFQTSSFKFQKLTNQNKRGLYLAAIVFTPANTTTSVTTNAPNEKLAERVVVTNDDRLPVVEISNELVAPAALMNDFYWLLKINGAQWVDIKQLRQQLQRSHSSSNLHLRIKLLNAIEQLQLALNLNDIGHLFYRPIQAHDGSQVICTCKQVSSTKQVSSLSTKWMQLDKILPRHLRKISDSFKRRQSNQPSANKPCPPVKPESLRLAPGYDCPPHQHHQVPLLTKRRPTMASNSSNSSLASSGGDAASGHWSQQGASADGRGVGSSVHNTCNQSTLQRHQQIATNRSNSGRSASLMVTPQTVPVGSLGSGVGGGGGACLLLASQQQQQTTSQLPRYSQPAATYSAQPTSVYLMQSSLSIYDLLLYTVQEILHFYFSSRKPLNGGLYLGFLQLQTTVESMRLLVPRARPNMVPCSRIRDNPHVSREEWALLRAFASNSATASNSGAPIIVSTTMPKTNQHLSSQCGASNRSSDPSIWRAQDVDGRLDKEPKSSSNRDRAKSISPGYLLQQQRDTKPLSVSTMHLGSSFFLKPTGYPMCAGKGAHSDTELSAGGESESTISQLRFCQVPQSASMSTAEMAASIQRRRNSSCSQGPAAGSRTRASSYAGPGADVPEHSFLRLVAATAQRLLAELKSQLPQVVDPGDGGLCSVLDALNNQSSNRIYHTELIELSEHVAVILLLPAPENVCPVTSQDKSNYLSDNRDYMFLPLQIFETIHISTYESELLGKYSRLSTILETDLVVAQHDHRQAFSNNELKSTKSRVGHLQDMVSMADEFWRKLRWIVDVVAFARDKSGTLALQSGGTIRLGSIWRYLELSGPQSVGEWDVSLNQQQRCLNWRGSGTCLVELDEPTGSHLRLGICGGSNQQLHELTINDYGRSSAGSIAQYITPDTAGDEDEEAIYAYHVSLKDASRAAAAKRRSPQMPVSNASGEPARPRAQSTMVQDSARRKPVSPPHQQGFQETPIREASDANAEKPNQLSEDPSWWSSSSSSLPISRELRSPESLEKTGAGEVLKELSARGQELDGGMPPMHPLTGASGSLSGVMLKPSSLSSSPDISLDSDDPTINRRQHQYQEPTVGQQETSHDSISGSSALLVDTRNRPTHELANDIFVRISGEPGKSGSGESSTTNRIAHLRTTNPFLSDSLD